MRRYGTVRYRYSTVRYQTGSQVLVRYRCTVRYRTVSVSLPYTVLYRTVPYRTSMAVRYRYGTFTGTIQSSNVNGLDINEIFTHSAFGLYVTGYRYLYRKYVIMD